MEFETAEDILNWIDLYKESVADDVDAGNMLARRIVVMWAAFDFLTDILAPLHFLTKMGIMGEEFKEINERGDPIAGGLLAELRDAILEYEKAK